VFSVGPETKVFTEDHREVRPGSAERGLIAKSGPIPLGYYKDPEKTARTFPVIDGVRYAIPGDWCVVAEDGTITLLGRGSACLNSAGEKIFPEEVEEALKTHPDVLDAIVVGLPDPRWGQSVTGIVQVRRGSSFHEDGLRQHVRSRLAGYKVPKRVVRTEAMFRGPNGKADYEAARVHAMRMLDKEARAAGEAVRTND
jgi:fatty-acyl-CoA synthase